MLENPLGDCDGRQVYRRRAAAAAGVVATYQRRSTDVVEYVGGRGWFSTKPTLNLNPKFYSDGRETAVLRRTLARLKRRRRPKTLFVGPYRLR